MNMRWRWIEISPAPMPAIGLGKIYVGRAEETEAHIVEALRLSPRDTMASVLDDIRGLREEPPRQLGASGRVVSTVDRGQSKLSACTFSVGHRPRAAGSIGRGAFRGQSRSRAQPVLLHLARPRHLDDGERRPDLSGPVRDHSRRHAHGRDPRGHDDDPQTIATIDVAGRSSSMGEDEAVKKRRRP